MTGPACRQDGIRRFDRGPPRRYQEIDGQKSRPVEIRDPRGEHGRHRGRPLRSEAELIIDPLVYSTFLGGGGQDSCEGIAQDAAGNIYIVGTTQSGNFPTTAGAVDTVWNGNEDVFVTKLNAQAPVLSIRPIWAGAKAIRSGDRPRSLQGRLYLRLHGFERFSDHPGRLWTQLMMAAATPLSPRSTLPAPRGLFHFFRTCRARTGHSISTSMPQGRLT